MNYIKNLVWLVSGLCLLTFLPAIAGGSGQFEGIVETTNLTRDDMGKPQEFVMTMWIKKDMVKVTHSALGSSFGSTMVYRTDRHERWILNEENKTYFSISQDSVEISAGVPDQQQRADPHTVKRTGKTRKILGYPAEQVLVRQNDVTTEIWGTKKLRDLARTISRAFGVQASQDDGGWTQELMKMGLFPLMSTTRLNGKVAESQTVTKIESRVLPEELFSVPAGYRRETAREMIRRLEKRPNE